MFILKGKSGFFNISLSASPILPAGCMGNKDGGGGEGEEDAISLATLG